MQPVRAYSFLAVRWPVVAVILCAAAVVLHTSGRVCARLEARLIADLARSELPSLATPGFSRRARGGFYLRPPLHDAVTSPPRIDTIVLGANRYATS